MYPCLPNDSYPPFIIKCNDCAALWVLDAAAVVGGQEYAVPPLTTWATRLSNLSLATQGGQVLAGAVNAQQTGNTSQLVSSGTGLGVGLIIGAAAGPVVANSLPTVSNFASSLAGATGAAAQQAVEFNLRQQGQPSCR